jgi:hypothetical protein
VLVADLVEEEQPVSESDTVAVFEVVPVTQAVEELDVVEEALCVTLPETVRHDVADCVPLVEVEAHTVGEALGEDEEVELTLLHGEREGVIVLVLLMLGEGELEAVVHAEEVLEAEEQAETEGVRLPQVVDVDVLLMVGL